MFLKNYYAFMSSMIFDTNVTVRKTNNTTYSDKATQGYNFNIAYDYYRCPTMYQPRFLHTTSTFNSGNAANGSNNSAGSGVYFGSGDTPVTLNDYTFAGEVLNTASASANVNIAADASGVTITGEYLINNTGSSDFTVREVGLVYAAGTYRVLVERTVLDEPVTIPAGGFGKVVYTVRMDYPTA